MKDKSIPQQDVAKKITDLIEKDVVLCGGKYTVEITSTETRILVQIPHIVIEQESNIYVDEDNSYKIGTWDLPLNNGQ